MLTKPLWHGRPKRYRTLPDGSVEEVNPVSEATAATLDRMRKAAFDREVRYFDLLREMLEGQTADPAELSSLMATLGKSESDLEEDLEARAAMVADEAEAQQVEQQKADLNKQIVELQQQADKFSASANDTYKTANQLQAEIDREHAKVAQKQKRAYATAVEANRSALEGHKQALERIEQLAHQLENTRPNGGNLMQVQAKRSRAKQLEKQEESDRAMQRYVDAQASEELPNDMVSAAVTPTDSTDPPLQQLGGDKNEVRMGLVRLG